MGLYLDSVGISLTRQNQEITIDSSQYYNLEAQKKIADGSIVLKKILECKINNAGEETWVDANASEESNMYKKLQVIVCSLMDVGLISQVD